MKIKIYNLTHKVLNNYTHNNSLLKIFPENGKYLGRFNPSILNIIDNFFIMTYRIWIDVFSENVYSYNAANEIGGPWHSGWTPYFNNNNEIKLNIFGISIIQIDEFNNDCQVIYDKIFRLEDNFIFIEDMRLFVDSENNIRFLANLKNSNINDLFYFNNIQNYTADRVMGTIKIDSKDNIINKIINPYKYLKYYKINNINLLLTDDLLTIEKPVLLCPHMHKLDVEKNWVHWKSSDNKDYITYFTYPFGNPLIHLNIIKFDKINYFDIDNSQNIKNNILCVKKFNPNIGISLVDFNSFQYEEIDFFKKINMYYFDCIKFSGGTSMIRFNNNENIGVGHMVINLHKLQNLINLKEISADVNFLVKKLNINVSSSYNLSLNLKKFYNKRINNNNHHCYMYLMFYYTINLNYPYNLMRISNAFIPKFINKNTGVVFPCGLELSNNEIYLSYGESDNLLCILKTPANDVDTKLMDIINLDPLQYEFNEYNEFNSFEY